MRLLILLLLICSQNLLSSGYYSDAQISNIIATTAHRTQSNVSIHYQLKINALKSDLRGMISNQRAMVAELTNKYEYKIDILKQKHDLELQANTLKYKNKNSLHMMLGGLIGIGATVGTYILVDSIELPLFKITF